VSTVNQSEKAVAFDLKFNNTTAVITDADYAAADPFGFGFGGGYSRQSIRYTNVAPGTNGAAGIDAVITATAFTATTTPASSTYSFVEHIPNFRAANTTLNTTTAAAYQDAAFLYQIAGANAATGETGLGKGGMNYNIQLFEGGTNTAYTAGALRFLVYDVDGEGIGGTATALKQKEAVRIAKGAGLVGYQVGSTAQALIPTSDATSYLFSGQGVNVGETDKSGAAIFYFQDVNSVNFQFEAETLSPASANPNPVFSAIDGDLSLYGTGALTGFAARVDTSATAVGTSTGAEVPEPFTIIGTLIGGTAAVRMRKKLKAGGV
jgi:hypothetical protein